MNKDEEYSLSFFFLVGVKMKKEDYFVLGWCKGEIIGEDPSFKGVNLGL